LKGQPFLGWLLLLLGVGVLLLLLLSWLLLMSLLLLLTWLLLLLLLLLLLWLLSGWGGLPVGLLVLLLVPRGTWEVASGMPVVVFQAL